MSEAQFVTREDLYDHVWKTPLRKLAADYGVSTHILARICKQLEVPTPAPGYWTKVAFSKNPRRPELPAISDGTHASARIERAPNTAGTIVQKTRLKAPRRDVKFPANLRACHPLVSATKRALEGVKPATRICSTPSAETCWTFSSTRAPSTARCGRWRLSCEPSSAKDGL